MTDEKLQAYLKFNDADLQANKEGRFSEKQLAQLAGMDQTERGGRIFMGIVCFVLAALSLVFVAVMGLARQDWSTGWPFAFCGVPIFGAFGIYLLRTPPARRKYKLRQVQNIIKYTRHIDYDSHNPTWKIMFVGRTRFDFVEDLSRLMQEGEEYLVFYYSRQGRIHVLSAELIPKEK